MRRAAKTWLVGRDGTRLHGEQWSSRTRRAIGALISGRAGGAPLLLLPIRRPTTSPSCCRRRRGSAARHARPEAAWRWRGERRYPLAARSVVLLDGGHRA
jgi:hypothetical protein